MFYLPAFVALHMNFDRIPVLLIYKSTPLFRDRGSSDYNPYLTKTSLTVS